MNYRFEIATPHAGAKLFTTLPSQPSLHLPVSVSHRHPLSNVMGPLSPFSINWLPSLGYQSDQITKTRKQTSKDQAKLSKLQGHYDPADRPVKTKKLVSKAYVDSKGMTRFWKGELKTKCVDSNSNIIA